MGAKKFRITVLSACLWLNVMAAVIDLEGVTDRLYDDYMNDRGLTDFTQLDGENFYESKYSPFY